MMTQSKIYLNVPYAQKDAAKALGARWDPTHKKWYVPVNLDVSLFDAWRSGTLDLVEIPVSPSKNTSAGIFTFPIDKRFVAYDGDLPPWD